MMDLDNIEQDFLWDIIAPDDVKKQEEIEHENHVKIHASHEAHRMRRITSEASLEKELDWHFERGTTYHCISTGDVDTLSYLRFIVKQQKIEYLLLSSWCMAFVEAEEIKSWLDKGYIHRIDFYFGDYFPRQYKRIYQYVLENCLKNGGALSTFKNHSKVMAGFGERFDFAIESSANFNRNDRCEQTAITVDTELALFYKNFYDNLNTKSQRREGWAPYQIDR